MFQLPRLLVGVCPSAAPAFVATCGPQSVFSGLLDISYYQAVMASPFNPAEPLKVASASIQIRITMMAARVAGAQVLHHRMGSEVLRVADANAPYQVSRLAVLSMTTRQTNTAVGGNAAVGGKAFGIVSKLR
jgi:hypothetical protein